HARTLNATPRYALSVGFNFTAVSLLAGLLLIQATTPTTTGGGQPTGADWTQGSTQDGGAAADDGTGGGTEDGTGTDGPAGGESAGLPLPGVEQPGDPPFFDQLTPDPLEATADVPALYDQGCQRTAEDTSSEPCEFGDLDGDVVVAVVGDSKVAQWVPALDTLGQEQGWLVRVYTKQACAFADSMLLVEDSPYRECRAWGQDVLDRLTGAERPDVAITSGVKSIGLPEDGAAEMTAEGLTDGYARFWRALNDQGTRVIALSDTPQPGGSGPVYECVDEHREDPSVCSWPYEPSPASGTLQDAVAQVEDAHFVDMDPWVCPGGTCVGVFRNVLTYRQGSHITATFVSVLTEPLAAYLVPLVDEVL
ncbi:hypothetical protein MWU75_19615, partial [Ornithinimicrobium sp. F0845]|uniref:SGNH hydrolase domain-containing protein n=1 Tax=Ornithinimicrobium sp. F0845 TaxID=2926412 RepID=UPI00248C4B89